MSDNGFSANKSQSQAVQSSAGNSNTSRNDDARSTDSQNRSTVGIAGLKSITKTGNIAGFSSDALDKMYAATEKVLKASGSDQIKGTILITKLNHRQQQAGFLSSILLTLVHGGARATHPLIIEGTDRLEPIRVRGHNRDETVSIPRPAGDVYCLETEKHYDAVSAQSAKLAGFAEKLDFVAAGGTLVPVELSALKEEELIASPAFNDLINRAKNALIVNIDIATDNEICLPIASICDRDSGLVYEAIIENRPSIAKVDATNLPIRSDIDVIIEAREKANRNEDRLQNETVVVAKTSIAVELEFMNEDSMRRLTNAHDRDEVNERYLSRFIITDSSTEFQFSNVQTAALSLYNAMLIAGDNRWYGAFQDKYTGGKDLNAIGAVGYECTHLEQTGGQPVFLSPKKTEDLIDLIENVVAPFNSFSYDVDMTAPDGWITAAMLAEAQGTTSAANYLIAEHNKMTNGIFGDILKEAPMFIDDNVVIPRGYINTPEGQIDIRCIGTLGILNLVGEESILDVEEYCSNFVDNGEDPLVRANRAIEKLKGIFGVANVHVKGYWRRITATTEYLNALHGSISKCGYDPVAPDSPFKRYESRRERSSVFNTARRSGSSFSSNRANGSSRVRNRYNMYN